jgi:hypothetical protein
VAFYIRTRPSALLGDVFNIIGSGRPCMDGGVALLSMFRIPFEHVHCVRDDVHAALGNVVEGMCMKPRAGAFLEDSEADERMAAPLKGLSDPGML